MTHLSRRSLLRAGVAVLAGCKTTTTYQATGEPVSGTTPTGETIARQPIEIVSVAMVGDSITEGSADELRALLAELGIDDVVIDGVASRRIEVGSRRNGNTLSGIGAVEEIIESGFDPSVWVIALGTNDVGGFGTPQDGEELITKITDLLPPPKPLVWVNVYRPSEPRQTRVFNEVLEGHLSERGNALVADWYAIATDPDRDVLRSDDLHPNDEGQMVFAELVVQALQRL